MDEVLAIYVSLESTTAVDVDQHLRESRNLRETAGRNTMPICVFI